MARTSTIDIRCRWEPVEIIESSSGPLPMNARCTAITLIAFLLAGCVAHEGTYSPSCIAYAGSKINLSDGQFVWEKFTDSVVVDDDGKIVNQFPGYPMRGAYRIDEQMVYMDSASGEPMENMYLHRHDDRYYLLTAEQFEAWEKTGEYAECALMLGGRPDD